ncbi:MAG: hypothetical protein ACFCUN_04535 [Hyphomicrobiaceae bacterium]
MALGDADALTLVASQTFELNYWTRQPPFYTWVLYGVTTLVGPSVLAVQVTKYGLMLVAAAGLLAAGWYATGDRIRAAIGALMVLLIFNVGFTIHDQSTHSVGLLAGLGLLFAGYARLATRGDVASFALVVVGSAVSVLAKHSGWFVVIALPVAFLAIPGLRARVLSWRYATAVLVFMALITPLALFMIDNWANASEHLAQTVRIKPEGHWLAGRLSGLASLAGGIMILVLPLLLATAFMLPDGRGRDVASVVRVANEAVAAGLRRDVLGAFAIALALIIVVTAISVAASGAMRVPSRHVLIGVIMAGLLIAWAARADRFTPRNLAAFVLLIVGLQAGLLAIRAATYGIPGRPLCDECTHAMPIRKLARELVARGMDRARIVTDDMTTAGNLRTHLPQLQVVALALPPQYFDDGRRFGHTAAGEPGGEAPCLLLDSESRASLRGEPGHDFEALMRAAAQEEHEILTLSWSNAIDGAARSSRWQLTRLPTTLEACR